VGDLLELRDGLLAQLQLGREQPDAARALGHEGASVGKEGQVPGDLEAGGDGL
jgi:hypothetical protein